MNKYELHKELLKLFEESASLFEWLDRNSLDGIWFKDLQSQCFWMSPKLEELLGYSENGMSIPIENWHQIVFRDDLPAFLANISNCCAIYKYPFDRVVRYYRRDGTIIWVRCRAKVFFDNEGQPTRMLSTHTDLTSQMLAAKQRDTLIKEKESIFRARQKIFDSMLDSIIVIDSAGTITEVNHATCSTFGYEASELIGKNIKILMGKTDAKQHDTYLENHFKYGIRKMIGKGREVQAVTSSGATFFAHLSVAEFSENGQPKFVGTLKNIDEMVLKRQELEKSVYRDHLTGLASRRLLEQKVESAISQCLREGLEFFVFFIDLNKFKPINDSFGHDIGDEVLKIIALRICHSVMVNDVCSRLGGDEFVVLSAPTSRNINPDKIIQNLHEAISAPIFLDKNTFNVSASIGVAKFPSDGNSREQLFNCADKKMYENKRSNQSGRTNYRDVEEDLVTLTYLSHSLINDNEIETACKAIRKAASIHNRKMKISGILLYCQYRFIQRLEGPRKAVDNLLEKIKSDKRHRNFTLLSYHSISERIFNDWSYMNVVFDSSRLLELEEYFTKLEIDSVMYRSEATYLIEYIKSFGDDPSAND